MNSYLIYLVALIYSLQFQAGSCSDENEDNRLPIQLHSLSEVVYRRQKLENYVVDEYIDIPNARSSVRLINADDSTQGIYYNQINPPDRPTKRKFIVYDPDQETCKFYLSRDWPLNKIREMVMQMLPLSKLSRELCDLILGPSALLYVVEASREDFQFIGRRVSEERLLNVDLYERVVEKDPDLVIKGKKMVIQVQVLSQHSIASKKLVGKNLATSYGEAKPEFVSIKVSFIDNEKFRNPGDECSEDELAVDVQYHIITSMLTGSLVGRELDETSEFDFNRDPFMQSVGIGCWKDVSYLGQKRMNAPKDQFSGLYVTTLGSPGVSYVAWDGQRAMLRLDREGRKSIYDLTAKKSYHHAEFVSLEQHQLKKPTRDKEKSCVVLDLGEDEGDDQSSSGKIRAMIELDQLLGLGVGNKASAVYLGSKMVEHVIYEVYELELFDSVPILMETEGFIKFDPDARYFMTYYVEEYRVERSGDSLTEGSATLMPKFIELHELHKSHVKDKLLINKLEFLEFSWSLEVEPSDDSEGLKSLFFIQECAQPRTNEVELKFGLRQDLSLVQNLPKRMEPTFRRQKQLIKQTVQSRMLDLIGLSDLNVARLDARFSNDQSVDMLVEAKLVELVDGLAEDTKLGYVQFFNVAENWQKWFISFKFNRHSLDECKLDSLMEKTKNNLMYCPSTTACVLIQPEPIASSSSQIWQDPPPPPPAKDSAEENRLLCELHSFKWAPVVNREAESMSLYGRVQGNLFELINRQFRIDFEHREKPQAATEFGRFVGTSHEPNLISLDELSLAGGSEADALLTGLRYATVDGTKLSVAVNMRRRAEVYPDFDPLRYCQQACQLDGQCQSFSVCLRPKKEALGEEDCVLSNLRLNKRMVATLAEKLREFKSKTEVRIELALGGQFKLQRQAECSLHPKDFVSAYRLVERVSLRPKYLNAEEKGTSLLTLEECAARTYDETVLNPERLAEFTHCPLSMSCLPDNLGSVVGADLGQQQACHVYRRHYGQFFRRQPQAHLAIDLAGSREPTSSMLHVEQRAKNHVTRAMFGDLDEEKCAQLCLASHQPCPAFDLCKMAAGNSGCFMYAIRSPAGGKIEPRLGLLPKEIEFYGPDGNAVTKATLSPPDVVVGADESVAKGENNNNNNNKAEDSPQQRQRSSAKIVANQLCSHHSLWPTYADILVGRVVGAERRQVDEPKGGGGGGDDDDEIGNEMPEDGKISDSAPAKVVAPKLSAGGRRHWALFLLGLALAAGGLICSQQVISCAGDLRARYQARGFAGPRLSQLALANVDELDSGRR